MSQKLSTISELEEAVNEWAVKYAKETWNMPRHAIRIIIWPTKKWSLNISAGTTAIIRIGHTPSDENFAHMLRRAIDHVALQHMYESVEIDRVADILRRDAVGRSFRRVRYSFDEELVPHMLPAHEVVVRRFTRVEVVHRTTGTREVVEEEMDVPRRDGRSLSIRTLESVAKARLSRRVHDEAVTDPTSLSNSDPRWIAKTV